MVNDIQNILDQVSPVIDLGYGVVASLLGHPCDWYRPITKDNPVSQLTHQDVVYVMFDSNPGFNKKKPSVYKDTQAYASLDRTYTLVGDYLVDQIDNQTYFINSQESITPTGVIATNSTLSFYRPTAIESSSGAYVGNGYSDPNLNEYGGNVDNLGDPLAANWPASVLAGTKGERELVQLPNQSRTPWYISKLPPIPGVLLQTGDLVIDQNGTRFLLSSVELSALGYNVTLDQVMVE